MAANTLPSGINDLFALAGEIGQGLEVYGPWLLRNSITAEKFGGLLAQARAAEFAFAAARSRKAAAAKRLATADVNLTSWLAKARLVVMLAYGGNWMESWLAAGFTHRGTNVPKRIGHRIELSRRLADFFAEYSEFEVPFAQVTAAHATALHKEIAAAGKEVRLASSDATEKKRARDNAEKRLRHEMRSVVLFLHALIGKGDPRWLAFGLNQPRPDEPKRTRVMQNGGSAPVGVDFAGTTVATGYEAVA